MWGTSALPSYVSTPKPADIEGFFSGSAKPGEKGRRIRDITDGTSNTVAVLEAAARPQVWNKPGVKVDGSGEVGSATDKYVAVSGWADGNVFAVRGYRYDTSEPIEYKRWKAPGPCTVNCTNYYSAYSFHSGMANVLLVDGSVRSVAENISTDTMMALLTVAGGEVIGEF